MQCGSPDERKLGDGVEQVDFEGRRRDAVKRDTTGIIIWYDGLITVRKPHCLTRTLRVQSCGKHSG